MPRFIALFRGINVGGHKVIQMEKLRDALTSAGYKGVETYVQSGNVVFDAGSGTSATHEKKINKTVLDVFGFDVENLVLSAQELRRAMKANPFQKKADDPSRAAICFLNGAPTKSGLETLAKVKSGPDQFKAKGKVLYLLCPTGFARTKLNLTTIERALGVKGTARNWNTVLKLCEMSLDKKDKKGKK